MTGSALMLALCAYLHSTPVLAHAMLTKADAEFVKPFVLGYLTLIGFYLLWRALGHKDEVRDPRVIAPLGLVGGFLDAAGGGGWGPVVTSNLLVQGGDPRKVIGTNTSGCAPRVVPSNVGGATPMIVSRCPFTTIVWLMTSPRWPNRLVQYAWLSTATRSPPIRSSSGMNRSEMNSMFEPTAWRPILGISRCSIAKRSSRV